MVEISFDGENYTKIYKAPEGCLIPWAGSTDLYLKPDERMVVMVRARSSEEIRGSFQKDLESFRWVVEKYRAVDPNIKVFYLVPRDFEDISEPERIEMGNRIRSLDGGIMVSPENVAGLDKEARRRIETGRMVRHE